MEIGAFEIQDDNIGLEHPRMIVTLRPWIDVGSVGTMAFSYLDNFFDTQPLGKLGHPGRFYDFTRYRPTMFRVEGIRHVDVPNSTLKWIKNHRGSDYLFLRILEPHSNSEFVLDSIVALAEYYGASTYWQIGSMYGATPHTRPLGITGWSSEKTIQSCFEELGIRASTYEGPTSIMSMTTEKLREKGISTSHTLVQLPPYARLEEDYRGQEQILALLDKTYDFGFDLTEIIKKADEQYSHLDGLVQADPAVKSMVRKLEQLYDAQLCEPDIPDVKLPGSVDKLLRDLEQGSDIDESPKQDN